MNRFDEREQLKKFQRSFSFLKKNIFFVHCTVYTDPIIIIVLSYFNSNIQSAICENCSFAFLLIKLSRTKVRMFVTTLCTFLPSSSIPAFEIESKQSTSRYPKNPRIFIIIYWMCCIININPPRCWILFVCFH